MPDHYTLLLEWRRAEGATRGLSKLPLDFYASTTAYLADVRKTYETELRENPSGRKGELARQTYQRASQVARDIIEARMTKILSHAFQASIGGTKELPNALAEERSLFDTLGGVLRSHRASSAPFLEPTGPAPARPAAGPTPSPPDRTERAPVIAKPTATSPTMRFVRILKDSPPVEVGSETIQLRKEDLLSLPEKIAEILIDGKIAEAVEAAPP